MVTSPTTRQLAGTTFLEQGSGVPVVLVHGAICDHRVWEAQREFVASRWRYIAVDLDYHGANAWPDDGAGYSMLHHVAQVDAFLRALDAGPVHLVGQSYGAHLVLRVALQAPELIRSLVLQEPAVESLVSGPEAQAILEERQRAFAPAGAAVLQGNPFEGAQRLVEAINPGAGPFESAPEYLQAMLRENARTLPLLFKAPPAPPITGAHLQQLKTPTLIINGAGTLRYFACVGEAIADFIPGARREVVPDAWHGVETQNPAAYWQLLSGFISTHDSLRR